MLRKHLKTLELEKVDLAKPDMADIRSQAKKAYRMLMLKRHTDRSLEKTTESTAKTALLNAANEFITNANVALTEVETELEAKKDEYLLLVGEVQLVEQNIRQQEERLKFCQTEKRILDNIIADIRTESKQINADTIRDFRAHYAALKKAELINFYKPDYIKVLNKQTDEQFLLLAQERSESHKESRTANAWHLTSKQLYLDTLAKLTQHIQKQSAYQTEINQLPLTITRLNTQLASVNYLNTPKINYYQELLKEKDFFVRIKQADEALIISKKQHDELKEINWKQETKKKKIKFFKKIYHALHVGQSRYFKTNFMADKHELSEEQLTNAIQNHLANPDKANSRTAKAWALSETYLGSFDEATNKIEDLALFSEIYKWCFENSGYFKMSTVSGVRFFSSASLNTAVDILKQDDISKSSAGNSRTALIYKALAF